MPSDLWNTPVATHTTPPFHATKGYPVPPGCTPEEYFYSSSGAQTDEERRFRGVAYRDTATGEWATLDQVEGGRFDDSRRHLYDMYRRLAQLHKLLIGPIGWETGWLYPGAEGQAYPNFCHVWEFAASGTGASITITWTTGGSDDDARALDRTVNSASPTCVMPGDWISDNRDADRGMAIVLDVTFSGETGGTHSATLTLSRPIDASRESKAWIVREHVPPPFPFLSLSVSPENAVTPTQCRHAVNVPHSAFSSFATAYPSLAMAAGIAGSWFCGQMNAATVDLSEFAAQCNNTACPLYEAHAPYYPTADDVSNFFLARGRYWEMIQQDGTDPNDWRIGREKWAGIMLLLGMPVGYYEEGLDLPKYFWGAGVLKHRTGAQLASGYDEFLDFLGWQQKRRDNTLDETDDVGLWAGISTVSKRDPAGGASPSDRDLVDDADRTPGFDFEDRLGVQRIGEIRTQNSAPVSGPGEAMVQRVRPKHYASRKFDPTTAATINDERTRVTVYDSAQDLTAGSSVDYTLKWELPRYCETVQNPVTRQTKNISGVIASSSISGNLLTLDIKLGQVTLWYPQTPPLGKGTMQADIAGNVVRGDIAHELYNPGCARKVGDRQSGIYVGDTFSFDHDDVRDVTLTVVAAKAFGGATQSGATAPHAAAPGVPQIVRDSHDSMDRIVLALEGRNGELIREWIDGLGDLAGEDIAIDEIAHSAIVPPSFDYQAAANGYAPTLKRVVDGEATDLTAGTHYVFDPNTGTAYIDASAWTDVCNLFFAGWVFDCRRTFPAEVISAMDMAVTSACDGWANTGSLGADTNKDLLLTIEYDSDDYTGFIIQTPDYDAIWEDKTPGTYPWNTSDLVVGYPEGNNWEGWKTGGPLSSYGVDANFPYDVSEPYWFSVSMQGLSVKINQTLGRCRENWIKAAKIEIEFSNALVEESLYEESGGLVDVDETNTLETVALQLILFKEVSTDVFESVDLGTISASDVYKIVEGEGESQTTYYRGTVDCTALVKFLVSKAHTDDKYFLLVAGGGLEFTADVTVRDLIRSWVSRYEGSITVDAQGDPTVNYYRVTQRELTYDACALGDVHVMIDESKLIEGPHLPFDGSSGYANGANLLHGE